MTDAKTKVQKVKGYAQGHQPVSNGSLVLPLYMQPQQVTLPGSHHPLKARTNGSSRMTPARATSQHVHNKYFCSEWMRLDQGDAQCSVPAWRNEERLPTGGDAKQIAKGCVYWKRKRRHQVQVAQSNGTQHSRQMLEAGARLSLNFILKTT